MTNLTHDDPLNNDPLTHDPLTHDQGSICELSNAGDGFWG